MSGQYDDELRGVLFPEQEKKNDRAPDFTGKVTVEGTEYRIAGWKRKATSSGRPFLSLSLSESITEEADVDPDGALDL
jgi:uncharacterized protein (DUF736 family)